jgi:hypothetical protein
MRITQQRDAFGSSLMNRIEATGAALQPTISGGF